MRFLDTQLLQLSHHYDHALSFSKSVLMNKNIAPATRRFQVHNDKFQAKSLPVMRRLIIGGRLDGPSMGIHCVFFSFVARVRIAVYHGPPSDALGIHCSAGPHQDPQRGHCHLANIRQ